MNIEYFFFHEVFMHFPLSAFRYTYNSQNAAVCWKE